MADKPNADSPAVGEANIPTDALSRADMLALMSGDSPKADSAKQPDQKVVAPDPSAAGGKDDASGGDNVQKTEGKPDGKPPVPDARKQKDDERFDRNWKKLQDEKDSLRAEREKHAQDLSELGELRRNRVVSEGDQQAREFDRLAAEFESEGNPDAANLARAKAKQSRSDAESKLSEENSKRFMNQWRSNFDKEAEQSPDLYDESTDLFKRVEALLKAEPVLRSMPDGISKAVSFIKNSFAAKDTEKLKSELADKDKRIQELTEKLTLGGSNPANLNSSATFEDMSQKDRKANLLARMIAGEK